MKKALLICTALTMSAAVSACSNDSYSQNSNMNHPDHTQMLAEQFFREMDTNNDGMISKKEYKNYTSEWFKEADVNDDGKLTLEEVKDQIRRDKHKMKQDGHHHHHHHHMMDDNSVDNGATPPSSNVQPQ